MKLSLKQKGVLRGMAAGVLAAVAIISFGAYSNPFNFTDELPVSQRLSVAIQAIALLAACLVFAVARLARHRFFTPEDIDGGGFHTSTDRAALLQSLLQNTLEQAVLATLIYMAWATTMPGSTLSVVMLAAAAFVIGRVLFFVGYRKGAPSRALGFALTFYPSVGMLVCIFVTQVWRIAA